MGAMVASYVHGCDMCQRVKYNRQRKPGLMMLRPVPEQVDSDWNMDHITGLPKTARGHDAIQGHYSRGGSIKRIAATDTTVDAERAFQIFLDSVVRHHGVPRSITSDKGPQFTAELWQALWARLDTKLPMTVAYRAEANGKAEREGQSLETWLRAFCTEHPEDWDLWLPLAELALNSMPSAGSGVSPYMLLYGKEPALSVDIALDQSSSPPAPEDEEPSANVEAAKQRWKEMAEAWQKVRGKLLVAQERMKRYADHHRRDASFNVGDRVLLSTEHLKPSDPKFNRKLAHLFCGPFPIVKVIGNAYELELPKHMKISPVFNIDRLRAYHDGKKEFPLRPAAIGLQRPPPDSVDASGEERYVVERVLAQRGKGKNAEYLILWKGYPYTDAMWQPLEDLDGAKDALDDFNKFVVKRKGIVASPSAPTVALHNAWIRALTAQARRRAD
jgi:hypothetical protein